MLKSEALLPKYSLLKGESDKVMPPFSFGPGKSCPDTHIQTSGTIFNRSVQLLAFADDIDIIGRSRQVVIESFLELEASAKKSGLVISEEKTKCMVTQETPRQKGVIIDFGPYKFEQVSEFTYLGSQVTIDNEIEVEIRRRIIAANHCCYGLRHHLKSHLVTRRSKIILYKTLIRPVLTYGSETWKTNQ